MPAVASIVLADAQGTPVNHTFVPLGPDSNGVWWFEDQSQVSAIGYWKISVKLVRPQQPAPGSNSKDRLSRVQIALHEPILETVSNSTVTGIIPAPTISYTSRALTEYILPERTTLEDRKNLRKMSYNLQNDSQIVTVIELLQNIY